MGEECDKLLVDLGDLLHGELPHDRADELRSHLDRCPPCLESADFQAQLKAMVAKRCGEEVPDGLRERLLGFLRDDQLS